MNFVDFENAVLTGMSYGSIKYHYEIPSKFIKLF